MKKKSIFSNRAVTITIIAVVVLIVLALVSSGNRTVTWAESAIGAVATPVQTFARKFSNKVVRTVQNLFNTTDADKENAKLKAKVAELTVALESYEELRQENDRLKGLLNYAETLDGEKYVTATVIANSNSVWFNMFTLNAGRKQGVEVNAPVVTGDGLVGIVTDVGATWCKVRSCIDSDSKISVIVERTRDNGFIRGTLKTTSNNKMELYFLPTGSDLTPGDVIITSGLGTSQIPKGITVGTVSQVMKVTGTDTNEANAIITPAVDFQHIEDVIIITSKGE